VLTEFPITERLISAELRYTVLPTKHFSVLTDFPNTERLISAELLYTVLPTELF
jgi:hypothetical protein